MTQDLTRSLSDLSYELKHGQCSARSLVEAALSRIAAINDAQHPVFLSLYTDTALVQADAVDRARAQGQSLPRFAGIPFAVKDLFDVEGETTTAGSIVLKQAQPAQQNATVVQRLLDAGMILVAKTNMTEFAFSGLGLNPHYGTPPAWGSGGRGACAPGGSSSGAGVSIAAGAVPVSLGTDTAGSCRIPAAWNGVVGYKPTQNSLPGDGAFPLSPLFDSPGPLTRRVSCSHHIFQLMAGLTPTELPDLPANKMAFAVPTGLPMIDLDPAVASAFQRAIDKLKAAGATVTTIDVPEFETAGEIFRSAPMATYQAWEIHQHRLQQHRESFDPFVAIRVSTGGNISEETQSANLVRRAAAIISYSRRIKDFDALLMPTTANLAPLLAPLLTDLDLFAKTNGRTLRNTSLSNFIDGCAISIPCEQHNEPAVGFSLCHANGQDFRLLTAAACVEKLFQQGIREQ